MPSYEFGQGEEKLAKAYELIAALQEHLILLAQREEIDSLMLGMVLSRTEVDESFVAAWDDVVASYAPSQFLRHVGSEKSMSSVIEELNRRTAFWSKVLRARHGSSQ